MVRVPLDENEKSAALAKSFPGRGNLNGCYSMRAKPRDREFAREIGIHRALPFYSITKALVGKSKERERERERGQSSVSNSERLRALSRCCIVRL